MQKLDLGDNYITATGASSIFEWLQVCFPPQSRVWLIFSLAGRLK